MNRNFEVVRDKEFDVVVIGAGIDGAGVAWDAALRGLRVLLIDKGDFGHGASAGCFRIVHGGLRYLQHLDIARLRDSVNEQRILRIIAPHLVRPLPFIVPCYGYAMRGKEVLDFALYAYELLALDRNKGVGVDERLPAHKVISRAALLNLAPGLSADGLRGGLAYYDCQMTNCERLTLAVAQGAERAGARLLNYAKVVGFEIESNDQRGIVNQVKIRDEISGSLAEVSAKCVVLSVGPWRRELDALISQACERSGLHENSDSANSRSPQALSKGVQLVLSSQVSSSALAIESKYHDRGALVGRGGRSYFLVPWQGKTLVGTSDELYIGDPDDFVISKQESQAFLAEVASLYKSPALNPEHLTHAFGGLRPVDPDICSSAKECSPGDALVSREDKVVAYSNRKNGSPLDNVFSVEGVKYTTFRSLAKRAVDQVEKTIFQRQTPCKTDSTLLPGADIGDMAQYLASARKEWGQLFSKTSMERLVSNYGSLTQDLANMIAQDLNLGEPIAPGSLVLKAEIVRACRKEMVCGLSDLVFRRTDLGTSGFPSNAAFESAAQIASQELGWLDENLTRQKEIVIKQFPLLAQ